MTLRWALVYFDILKQRQTWETDTQSEKHKGLTIICRLRESPEGLNSEVF